LTPTRKNPYIAYGDGVPPVTSISSEPQCADDSYSFSPFLVGGEYQRKGLEEIEQT
jgi:hypothetical protein